MTDLSPFAELVPLDHGLCVLATTRPDASVQATVVNAGVLDHPLTGERVVGLVAAGAVKLRNLRIDRRATITIRAGWRWATIEGTAELFGPGAGPGEAGTGLGSERLRLLFREVFRAAGGTHDDWDVYDRAMLEERRVVVLVAPTRVYTNPR